MIGNFDFVLYILNRREKSEEICDRKYEIIVAISKSNYFLSGNMDKQLCEQFINYIKKGSK